MPGLVACITALGDVETGVKDVMHQLGQAATLNASDEVREAAVKTLGKIGLAHPELRKPILAYLKIALQSKAAVVRVTALMTAGSFGPDAKGLLAAIRAAAKDDNADVQKAAAEAIAAIEKKN